MKKSKMIIGLMIGIAAIFTAVSLYAGTTVKDVITMNNPAYEKHTKGIIDFTHKKHVDEYKASCGDCHHDDKGKPLDLKAGDNVQSCLECHKETGKLEKGLKKKEKIARYHKEALHANCKNCHKDHNKKVKKKVAPEKCNDCHPKK